MSLPTTSDQFDLSQVLGHAPDQLKATAFITGNQIRFTCAASKYNSSISKAELRLKFVASGSLTQQGVDLRIVAEGGTFADNGTTQLIVTTYANKDGAQYSIALGSSVGNWYYAWRLKNTSGWSAWTSGDKTPSYVTDYISTTATNIADTGPPSGWTVSIIPGPTSGTAVVIASRPQTNGARIWDAFFQIRDARAGSWREPDANAGAAVTYYDGSAIAHAYNPATGTITKASGNYGNAASNAGWLIYDRRGSQFGIHYVGVAFVDPTQISGTTISGLSLWAPAYAPDGNGIYQDLRIKIVKSPDWWNNTSPANTDGYFATAGWNQKKYYENSTVGDLDSSSFKSDPFILPAGITTSDLKATVFFLSDYSFSNADIYSDFGPSTGNQSESGIVFLTCASSVTIDCSLGIIYYMDLDQNVVLNFSGMKHGTLFEVVLRQDSSGGHTISFDAGANIRYSSNAAGITSDKISSQFGTAAYSRNYFLFQYDADAGQMDIISFEPDHRRS